MTLNWKKKAGLLLPVALLAAAALGWLWRPVASGPLPAATAAALAPAAAVAPPSRDGIALAPAQAAAVRQASDPGAWGGARSPSEPTLSDRVVYYEIEATLDPERHTVDGRQRLTWRNRSAQAVQSVYLHLYLNAFEGAGSTFYTERQSRNFSFRTDVPVKDGEWGHIELRRVVQGGAPVPWYFVHPDGGPETDHTVVRLDLPEAVPAGASTTLEIDFFDQLPRVVARTGYFGSFHLVGQWYPKIAVLELPGERGATAPRWNAHEFHLHSEFYADYGLYDVRLTVPQGVTVGATGQLQREPVLKDGQVTHHYVQGDVHDFAWTADRRTAPPLEGSYRGEGSPEVQVRVLFPPEYASNAPAVLQATLDSLAYFSRTLGPYPYRTVTAVIPPFNADEAGGMEYPTFFTVDHVLDLQPDTVEAYKLDFVTIHEFGHDYFYGILGSNEFEEPMLDEGLNEYWNARMMRERRQTLQLVPRPLRGLGLALKLQHFEIERPGADRLEPADAVGHNAWDRLSSHSYGSVYARSATLMRDLEAQLGQEVMERAFKTYYARWKFRHPSIADFREVLAEVSGRRALIEAVFEQQVYAAQAVDDRIDSFSSKEELPQAGTVQTPAGWVEETEDQVDARIDAVRRAWRKAHPDAKPGEGPFPYRTTVTLRRRGAATAQVLVVKFSDGSQETVRWDRDSRWERATWVKPVRAVSAELDPQHAHWLDASKIDDSRTLQAERSLSRLWGGQWAALVQLLVSWVASV